MDQGPDSAAGSGGRRVCRCAQPFPTSSDPGAYCRNCRMPIDHSAGQADAAREQGADSPKVESPPESPSAASTPPTPSPTATVALSDADRELLARAMSSGNNTGRSGDDATGRTLDRMLKAQMATANYTRVISLAVFLVLWNSLMGALVFAIVSTVDPYSNPGGLIFAIGVVWLILTFTILFFIGRAMTTAANYRQMAETEARR